MRWWKISPNPPSSSSSTSSPRRSSSSPVSPHRCARRDLASIFSRRDVQHHDDHDHRHQQPRLTRQRKLRHLSDVEVGALDGGGAVSPRSAKSTPVSRTPSNTDGGLPSRSISSPQLLPQPLPLPVSGQLVFEFSSPGGRPSSSPKRASSRANAEEENGAAADSSPPMELMGERISSVTAVGG